MTEVTLESVKTEIDKLQKELNRRRWVADPVPWSEEKIGDVIWSKQKEILRALKKHQRVAVMTCHGVGKSFSAGTAAAWWLDIYDPGEAMVVTTAPTGPQVKIILWKEIGRIHERGKLKGRLNQTEWLMDVNGKMEIVALGRKPSDYSPTAFQGIHSPHVLVIVDEANGVRGTLHDAIDSLIANEGSKILMIGNPDDPSGEFYDACKPGSGWFVIQIGAFDTPNFTGEPLPETIKAQLIGPSYVERNRKKWAASWVWEGNRCVMPEGGKLEDTHPFWQSKILGQFPVQSGSGSLIPLTWIQQAQARKLPPSTPVEMGLDVGASEDGDPSCLGWRRGPVFRVLYEERQPDTMKTLGKMLQHLHNSRYGASVAKVDYIGVGRGVVDRAREEKEPVIPISVGMQAKNPREFANLLSEIWWEIRGLFERGEIDIDENDVELGEELLTMWWEPNSKGQTVVHYGDGPSPNRADSLLMTFAPVDAQTLIGTPIALEKVSTWFKLEDIGDRSQSRWRSDG